MTTYPNHWRQVSIAQACQNIKTKVVNPLMHPEETFEYYSIPAYQENGKPLAEKGARILSNKIVVTNGTVLFGKLNPRVLKVWLVSSTSNRRKIATTEFLPILANQGAEPEYLYFLCQSSIVVEEASRLVSGSTPSRERVDPNAFYQIMIPLPPLNEQRSIASTLRTVQEAQNTRLKELTLERERKAALMENLFTCGVRGKTCKQTEIGLMPENWSLDQLGRFIASGPQNGLYKHSSEYGSGIPIIRINDFDNNGKFITTVFNRVRLSDTEVKTFSVQRGDLLINRVNSLSHIGKCAFVQELMEATVYESNMMRFRLCESHLLPDFLRRYLTLDGTRERIRSMAKRAVGQSSINQGDIRSILVPLPDIEEQQAIAEVLTACDQKIATLEAETALLDEFFRALLEELMIGSLSVLPLLPGNNGASG